MSIFSRSLPALFLAGAAIAAPRWWRTPGRCCS